MEDLPKESLSEKKSPSQIAYEKILSTNTTVTFDGPSQLYSNLERLKKLNKLKKPKG